MWTYHDWEGNSVSYIGGYPDFKSAGLVIQEIDLEIKFKGRTKDFALGDKLLKDKGNSRTPDTTWHHHQDGHTLQEINSEYHKRFTHMGGISALGLGKKKNKK